MRTKIKQLVAFATLCAFHTAPKEDDALLITPNYRLSSDNDCEEVNVDCTTENTGTICMDQDLNQLYGKFNEFDSNCPRIVYKPIQ